MAALARVHLASRYRKYTDNSVDRKTFIVEMIGKTTAWVLWDDGREHKMPLDYIRQECVKL